MAVCNERNYARCLRTIRARRPRKRPFIRASRHQSFKVFEHGPRASACRTRAKPHTRGHTRHADFDTSSHFYALGNAHDVAEVIVRRCTINHAGGMLRPRTRSFQSSACAALRSHVIIFVVLCPAEEQGSTERSSERDKERGTESISGIINTVRFAGQFCVLIEDTATFFPKHGRGRNYDVSSCTRQRRHRQNAVIHIPKYTNVIRIITMRIRNRVLRIGNKLRKLRNGRLIIN